MDLGSPSDWKTGCPCFSLLRMYSTIAAAAAKSAPNVQPNATASVLFVSVTTFVCTVVVVVVASLHGSMPGKYVFSASFQYPPTSAQLIPRAGYTDSNALLTAL